MIWPEKLKICGTEFDFEVKDVPPTGLPISEWGECDGCKLSIAVYVNGQKYHDLDTLIHEVLHAGCDGMGLDFGDNENAQHRRISSVARFMSQFLLDNKFIKWNNEPTEQEQEQGKKEVENV